METTLKQKLFYFFPVLLCFCLPFGGFLLSVLVGGWLVLSFFNFQKEQFLKGIKDPNFLLMMAFFSLTCASAAFSENKAEGLKAIEVKLSFLIFPFLMFCFRWPLEILKRCVVAFVSGCFFACLYLIGRAALYAFNGHPDYFFYSLFSDFIHASYFAMYLIMAITFVLLLYDDWFRTQKSIIYSSYFFVAIFVTTVFLCSSKLGIITLFICLPVILIYKYKPRLTLKTVAVVIVSIVIVFFIARWLFPGPFERWNSLTTFSRSSVDKTSSESTTVRVLIWEQSLELVKENFLAGTGVGDANDELYETYRVNGLTGAYEHRFNAHSQYFQTFIGLGIVGFLLLLGLTFWQLLRSVARRDFFYFIFSFLIVLNFFVESMLQTSAGVLFFGFFFCFLHQVNEKQLRG